MSDQLRFLLENAPSLLIGFPGHRPGGLILSILLAVFAIGLGLMLAFVLGAGYASRFRVLRAACHAYVQIFRGIPILLLLLIIHQLLGGIRQMGVALTPAHSALLALTLYSSAYQAEILRAGLQAVPEQLTDSARTLGGSPRQTYRRIQLRHALHTMTPALTGQAISLFKDTSVVVILGVADLMTVARIVLGSEVGNAPYWVSLYLLVGFMYYGVALGLSRFAQRWERRRQTADLVHSLANY